MKYAALALIGCAMLQGGSSVPPRMTPREIDQHFARQWREARVRPAALLGDSGFLRRVTIDLAGRLPTQPEVEWFMASTDRDKRTQVIDALLENEDFALTWADRWRRILLGTNLQENLYLYYRLDEWIADQLRSNRPYSEIATDIVAAEGMLDENGAALYTLRWENPPRLAANAGLSFLGISMRCAQCHDHPFDSWTQEEFWGFAAFFARARIEYAGEMALPSGEMESRLELDERRWGEVDMWGLPESDRAMVVPPQLPGESPVEQDPPHRRDALAEWMTSPENPYFARALVNRVWSILMGRGFFDPDTGLQASTQVLHEELLDRLAAHFVEHGFDLKDLIRLIASTQTYQLASADVPPAPFAAGLSRRMDGWEMFRTLEAVSQFQFQGYEYDDGTGTMVQVPAERVRQQSLEDYRRPTSALQEVIRMTRGDAMQQVIWSEGWMNELGAIEDPEALLDALFLRTLSRRATPPEHESFMELIYATEERYEGLQDALWTLLNTSEFARRP